MPSPEPPETTRCVRQYRQRIKRHLKDCIDSLTIHGAAKVLKGTIPECLLWGLILVGVFTYFFITAHTLLSQFTTHSFITNYEVLEVENINLPSVTVCDRSITICGFTLYSNKSDIEVCNKVDLRKRYATFKNNVLCYKNGTYIRNCYEVSPHFPGCVNINAQQSVVQNSPGRHKLLRCSFIHGGNGLYLFHHNKREVISWSNRLKNQIRENGYYDIVVTRRDSNRLPAPFRSNCSKSKVLTYSKLFPYSKYLCHQQCIARHMMNMCGVVGDYWKPYLPSSIYKNISISSNNTEDIIRRKCIYKVMYYESVQCKCRNPCKETVYDAKISMTSKAGNRTILSFYFENLEIHKSTELPAYDKARLMANMGGLVGLLVGMSMLSVFEVVVCLFLYIVDIILMLILKLY